MLIKSEQTNLVYKILFKFTLYQVCTGKYSLQGTATCLYSKSGTKALTFSASCLPQFLSPSMNAKISFLSTHPYPMVYTVNNRLPQFKILCKSCLQLSCHIAPLFYLHMAFSTLFKVAQKDLNLKIAEVLIITLYRCSHPDGKPYNISIRVSYVSSHLTDLNYGSCSLVNVCINYQTGIEKLHKKLLRATLRHVLHLYLLKEKIKNIHFGQT